VEIAKKKTKDLFTPYPKPVSRAPLKHIAGYGKEEEEEEEDVLEKAK
jgi:hypothetical protein